MNHYTMVPCVLFVLGIRLICSICGFFHGIDFLLRENANATQ